MAQQRFGRKAALPLLRALRLWSAVLPKEGPVGDQALRHSHATRYYAQMPDSIRFVAQMVFLLYAACAGVILAMNKVGHLTASMAHTKYTPESGKNLLAWRVRTKLLHGAVFVLVAVIAFWP